MSLDTMRRGRPKGSGLDDQKHLEQIAEMISNRPEMKPTTAIKALGISDPSTIRRLRDKFNQFSSGLPGSVAAPASAPSPRSANGSEPRAMAANVVKPSVTLKADPVASAHTAFPAIAPAVAAVATAPVAVTDSPRPVGASFPTPADMFIAWYSIGLSALSSVMSTQATMASSIVRFPHIELALRQQLVASEMAMALHPLRAGSRPRLH